MPRIGIPLGELNFRQNIFAVWQPHIHLSVAVFVGWVYKKRIFRVLCHCNLKLSARKRLSVFVCFMYGYCTHRLVYFRHYNLRYHLRVAALAHSLNSGNFGSALIADVGYKMLARIIPGIESQMRNFSRSFMLENNKGADRYFLARCKAVCALGKCNPSGSSRPYPIFNRAVIGYGRAGICGLRNFGNIHSRNIRQIIVVDI